MSRNGAGTYTLPAGNPVVTGTTISSTWSNNTLSDIATALTQSLAKDGQTVPTANIPLGGFKITGLGAPTTAGDALAFGSSLGAVTATTGTFSGNVQMASQNGGQLAGLRNRIINGAMQVSQRNSGSSFNITTTSGYTLDRWQGQTTGATVTGQQAGYANTVGLSSVSNSYSVTGAASNTGVFLIQRIEAKNCRDLAGQSVTLSLRAYVSGAAPTSFNWALRYATVTDTFTSVTAISNGTFTLTTADNVYSATISVPTAATTGLELLLSTGAFTSGTLFFTNVQLELGPISSPFEQIPYGLSLQLCQRYFQAKTNTGAAMIAAGLSYSATAAAFAVQFPVSMRALPALSSVNLVVTNGSAVNIAGTGSSIANFSGDSAQIDITVAGGLTIGQASLLRAGTSSGGSLFLSSEL